MHNRLPVYLEIAVGPSVSNQVLVFVQRLTTDTPDNLLRFAKHMEQVTYAKQRGNYKYVLQILESHTKKHRVDTGL